MLQLLRLSVRLSAVVSWLALLRGLNGCYTTGKTEMRRGLARVHKRPFAGVFLLRNQANASGCVSRFTLNHARDSVHYRAECLPVSHLHN